MSTLNYVFQKVVPLMSLVVTLFMLLRYNSLRSEVAKIIESHEQASSDGKTNDYLAEFERYYVELKKIHLEQDRVKEELAGIDGGLEANLESEIRKKVQLILSKELGGVKGEMMDKIKEVSHEYLQALETKLAELGVDVENLQTDLDIQRQVLDNAKVEFFKILQEKNVDFFGVNEKYSEKEVVAEPKILNSPS